METSPLGTPQDVEAEPCDLILTAMVALTNLNPDARKVFARRLDHIAHRSPGPGQSDPTCAEAGKHPSTA